MQNGCKSGYGVQLSGQCGKCGKNCFSCDDDITKCTQVRYISLGALYCIVLYWQILTILPSAYSFQTPFLFLKCSVKVDSKWILQGSALKDRDSQNPIISIRDGISSLNYWLLVSGVLAGTHLNRANIIKFQFNKSWVPYEDILQCWSDCFFKETYKSPFWKRNWRCIVYWFHYENNWALLKLFELWMRSLV